MRQNGSWTQPKQRNHVFRRIIDDMGCGHEESGSTESEARSDRMLRFKEKEHNVALFERN